MTFDFLMTFDDVERSPPHTSIPTATTTSAFVSPQYTPILQLFGRYHSLQFFTRTNSAASVMTFVLRHYISQILLSLGMLIREKSKVTV